MSDLLSLADLDGLALTGIREAVTAGGVPVLSADLPRGTHDTVWRTLRARHARTGLWPVLSHLAHKAAGRLSWWTEPADELLEYALSIDPAERMNRLVRWSLEFYQPGYDEATWAEFCDPETLARRLGPVTAPVDPVREASWAHRVLLVPARAGYEVPALVPGLFFPQNWMGGPDHDEIEVEDTVAVLRHWEERHGAEMYFAAGATLDLAVSRPPTAPLDVARCAIEQAAFCQDLGQFIGDEADVARRQVPAPHWHFWWD